MKDIWAGVCVLLFIWGVPSDASGQSDSLAVSRQVVAPEVLRLPSPTGALLRSTALPGWGQFYNRKPLKGSLFLILQAGLFTGVLLQRESTQAGGLTPLGNTLLLGLIGVRIYSMADAYVDAHFADFDDMSGRRPGMVVGLRVRW